MKGILGRFWFAITSLVLIILLAIWLFQIGLLNYFYINEREGILLNEANKLNALIQDSDSNNIISSEVLEEIESFTSSVNARVIIVDIKNKTLFYNSDRFLPAPKDSDRNQYRAVAFLFDDSDVKLRLGQNQTFSVIKKRPDHEKSIFIGAPVLKGEEAIANIIITSPLASIEETITILKKQLSLISILSLGIGTLLALSLAKYFTRPILSITNVTKQISKGNFNAKVLYKSKDEIGVLSETINDMARQLDKIEQLRREFIANISHELKTPISLIRAYAELLEEMNTIDVLEKKSYLQVITDESNRLNGMIEDILYLSKMEAGFSNLVWEDFYLDEVLDNVIEKLSFFASNKNIEIAVEGLGDSTTVYGDKDKLYQVFYNIINNAIQHSPEKGKILIKILEDSSTARVEIIDEGKGIPEEDLPHIWDRFYKVDKSRKRDDSGTGLGMAIVKNILEAHRFVYGISSKLNSGTMVWFEITKK